jgi:hypothetical protein
MNKRPAILIRAWKQMQDKRIKGLRHRKSGRISKGGRLIQSAWKQWDKAIVKFYGHNPEFSSTPNGCKVEGAEYTHRQR